jgi:hypothetical protein
MFCSAQSVAEGRRKSVPTDDLLEVIDQYCSVLRKALHKVPTRERDDIVEEVRSHIVERIDEEREPNRRVLAEIIKAVGEPDRLASEYETQVILQRAAVSRSPWLLLRATLRWAMTGVAGVIAFTVTLVGYGLTAVFLLAALLKPFFPSRIGLWLRPEHTLSFGYWNGQLVGTEVYGISVRSPASLSLFGTIGATTGPVRELLGYWLIPVSILCAVFFFLVTTLFAKWLIRRSSRKKQIGSTRCSNGIKEFALGRGGRP